MSGDTIQLGPHQTLEAKTSTPEALEVEATWIPGGSGPPPAHLHPNQAGASRLR